MSSDDRETTEDGCSELLSLRERPETLRRRKERNASVLLKHPPSGDVFGVSCGCTRRFVSLRAWAKHAADVLEESDERPE